LEALYEEKDNFFDDIIPDIEDENKINFIDDEDEIQSCYDEEELNKKMEGLHLTNENYKNKEEFDSFEEIESKKKLSEKELIQRNQKKNLLKMRYIIYLMFKKILNINIFNK